MSLPENELEQLNDVTTRFFGVFDNREGKTPDWNAIYQCCIPECTVFKLSDEGIITYSLSTFIEPRQQLLSDGTLTDFHEYEVKHETTISGNIAQRFSRYEKTGILHGKPWSGSGSKCFQFVKTADVWKICAVLWEDDPVRED